MTSMTTIEVKAPANVKISGEHSVIYGGSSLSVAIPLFATAKISDSEKDKLEIDLQDLSLSKTFDLSALERLYKEYCSRDTSRPDGLANYIEKNEDISKELLPYATIAARLFGEYGVDVLSKKVT